MEFFTVITEKKKKNNTQEHWEMKKKNLPVS